MTRVHPQFLMNGFKKAVEKQDFGEFNKELTNGMNYWTNLFNTEVGALDPDEAPLIIAALEELAVCDACENITEEQILALKEAADNFQAALESDDLVKCAETDMAFHEIIYSATNNKRLLQILNNLREQMYRYRMEYLKEPGTHKLLLKEHEAIYSALKKHDKAEAGGAIRIHIENQRRSIISSLRDAGRITEQV